MPSVLVVEDERDIRDLLRRYLERDGFAVVATGSGAEAMSLLDAAPPDLMLLDLGLPDIEGVEVLREAAGTVPVIVLTARASVADRVLGLSEGADDYVSKPFSPTEVVLRVHAVLSRGPRLDVEPDTTSYCRGRLVIDEARHEVRMDGGAVQLTVSEWNILIALASAPRRVFSRGELGNRLHGYTSAGYERSIDSHVKNLRHKLHDHGELVQTVVGVGYRLGCGRDR